MIGVIAATGFTGRLVASELKKLGAQFFIAARNDALLRNLSDDLGGVPSRKINVQDKSTFKALEDCNVMINCAGPFTDLGEPVVQEALSRRSHYLDLTGEQAFIKLVYDKYDEQARAAGVALVPACAFEYAIGDAAGALLCADLPDCNQVELIYHIQGAHTSAGTRKSIIRALSAPGYQFSQGRLVQSAPGSIVKKAKLEKRNMSLMSFPAGEILMLPRHTDLKEVTALMAVDIPSFILPLLPKFGQKLIRATANLLVKTTNPVSPTTSQRQNTRFTIKIRASNASQTREITVSGTDPYGLTAVIVAAAAMHLEHNQPSTLGAITPSMIGGGALIRDLLIQAGVSWTESS